MSIIRLKKISTLNLPAFALVLNLDLILAGFGRGRRKILLLPDEIVLKGLRSVVAATEPPLFMKEGGNQFNTGGKWSGRNAPGSRIRKPCV